MDEDIFEVIKWFWWVVIDKLGWWRRRQSGHQAIQRSWVWWATGMVKQLQKLTDTLFVWMTQKSLWPALHEPQLYLEAQFFQGPLLEEKTIPHLFWKYVVFKKSVGTYLHYMQWGLCMPFHQTLLAPHFMQAISTPKMGEQIAATSTPLCKPTLSVQSCNLVKVFVTIAIHPCLEWNILIIRY